jgi:hypothetical protein
VCRGDKEEEACEGDKMRRGDRGGKASGSARFFLCKVLIFSLPTGTKNNEGLTHDIL